MRPSRPLALAVALLAAPLASAQAPGDAAARPAGPVVVPPSRWAAPDFALPALAGDTFRLADRRGDVVVVNVWATWCGPCRAEMPAFDRLHAELAPRGLTFVGVSIDEGGWAAVRPFAERLGVRYPLVLDDGQTGARFGSSGIVPVTYVIDRAGRVRIVAEGAVVEGELRPILLALLAEPAPPAVPPPAPPG